MVIIMCSCINTDGQTDGHWAIWHITTHCAFASCYKNRSNSQ